MQCVTPVSISRPRDVRRRCSDSGVVIRTCGGRRSWRCLSEMIVSPVRTDDWEWKAHGPSRGDDAFEWFLEIALNVVIERLQWGDVENTNAAANLWLTPQLIETGEERGQSLARAGRRQDERVLAGGDDRPALLLRRGWLAEGASKPLANRRQKQVESVGFHADIVRMYGIERLFV